MNRLRDEPPTSATGQELTTSDFWRDSFWQVDAGNLPDVTFDPDGLEFRPLHRLFQRYLPAGPLDCLEVGCAPGRYLWYFQKHFGHSVSGIEYVPEAAQSTERALAAAGVSAEVMAVDLFDFQPPAGRRYGLVFSCGVIEHFADIRPAIARHAALVAPGGHLLIWVPNHVGINGWLMRATQPEFFRKHNRMSWRDLRRGIEDLPDFEIIHGGYWGHFNLASSNFLPWYRQHVPYRVYRLAEKPHNLALRCNSILPNSVLWSPYIGVIARRVSA